MKEFIKENLQFILLTAVVWGILLISVIRRPQHFRNSFLLMFALLVTQIFISLLFGPGAGTFLLISFISCCVAIFCVPTLFVINGIITIKHEGVTVSHMLSLITGVLIGLGEIASIYCVLRTNGAIVFEKLDWIMLYFGMSVFYVSIIMLAFIIYVVFIQIMPHRMDFDYIIIHGAGLIDGDRISRLFASRIDKAIDIYNKCGKKPVIIASGGQGNDEKMSESEAMRGYLREHGIPEEKILTEDKSVNTFENIRFSKELILGREEIIKKGKHGKIIKKDGKVLRVALVSSNYHIYRCISYASKQGMNCIGIGAGVRFYYWVTAVIREFIAVVKQKKHLIIFICGYLLFLSIPLILMLR